MFLLLWVLLKKQQILRFQKNSVGSDEQSRASRAMSFAPDDLMDIDANVQYAGRSCWDPFLEYFSDFSIVDSN